MYHFWRIHQLIPILISCISLTSIAQDPDSLKSFKKENIKTGFSLGGIPVVSYNSDIGFKYGARVNLYWFGDGSKYPSYNHSLFAEWSRTTLGNGINQITFESNQLIPSIRLFAEASYLTEKALDFYGYNGYQAVYSQEF
ncbi:MAG: hypothetical protein U9R60_04675, partial [Bacteroidota bacterium]|nr:hypothetical protein [Bacteroidota bacterium]